MQERRRSWSVVLQSSGKFPCAVCCTGVDSNTGSTRNAVGSSAWQRTLTTDVHGARELHVPWTADHRGKSKSDLTSWRWYFLLLPKRHALSSRWLWTFNHNTCENHLKEVQEAATSSLFTPFKTHERVYSSYVRSAMLHASETWPLTKPNLQLLQRNDRAMITQICNVRPQDVATRSNELLARLGIEDLDLILKVRRLRWYGHVEHSNGAVKTAFHIQAERKRGPGRPKMTWKQLTKTAESGSSRLSTLMIEICGDPVWDLPCVQQANYLEGGPMMWILPLYLHVNQKSDYDMIWWYWNPYLHLWTSPNSWMEESTSET